MIPVLIPLNYINGRGHRIDADGLAKNDGDNTQVTGLDTLAWGNIRPSNTQRYWAHLVMAVITVAWVCALVFFEMRAYIKVRQTHLTSVEHRLRPSAATILVSAIPASICNDSDLRKLFNNFPGGVKNIWINKDLSLLLQMINRRNEVVQQLETAETTLIRRAHYAKKRDQGKNIKRWWQRLFHTNFTKTRIRRRTGGGVITNDISVTVREKFNSSGIWDKLFRRNDRLTCRLPHRGLRWLPRIAPFSKKTDTISECREKLHELNTRIEEQKRLYDDLPPANSAFIQFHNQIAAHMACQSEIHHLPEHMTPRSIGFSPDEIIWTNLVLTSGSGWARTVITYGVLFLMLSFWSIPVAWTGALSQVDQLVQGFDLLPFNEHTEILRHAMSAVAGLLPTMALTTLLILLPLFLEHLAGFKGVKTYSLREEFVQTFYFAFLFIQVFLVVSIASFFTASIKELVTNVRGVQEASEVINLLAQNLPRASNYFFSYMVLQSFSTSSATLLQVGSLISHYILAPLFDTTPRDKWVRKTRPRSVKWGSVFPIYTNFACIALIYCIISPIISAFAILTFGLMWVSQRYAIVNFYQPDHDTGGVLYPRALNQTFTGVYVMELCLIGLFFMAKDENADAVCSAHAVIMVIVLVATVLFQTFLNWRFAPLFRFLPIELGSCDGTVVLPKQQMYSVPQLQHGPLGETTGMDEGGSDERNLHANMTDLMITEFPTALEEIPEEDRESLVNNAFKHHALTVDKPTIWIPRDEFGVSDDEIYQCKQVSDSLSMSTQDVYLDDHGRVVCDGTPPDVSKFTYVKL